MIQKNFSFSKFMFIFMAIFLILPLLVLVAYSFNDGKNSWTGFSLRWYEILLTRKPALWQAFFNSIVVAVVSAIIATILGTFMAISLNWYDFRLKKFVKSLNYLPLVLPEIVVALSLAILFSTMKLNLGLVNVILAHVSFCVPFVTLMVLARLDQFDNSLLEAAADLGAKQADILTKVIIPTAFPGIMSGFITAITLSLEDFVITAFVGSVGSTTLPVAINNAIRKDPDSNVVYALSVILIIGIILIAIAAKRFLKYLVKR